VGFLKKSFLYRRKVDQWVLGAASAAMPIRLGLGPIILFLFSCLGIYLSCARHATTRLFAKKFFVFILLYAGWSLGLILFRGEPFTNNRQIGYTLLIGVFAFAAPGMVLIRNPLRFYVIGSRAGVIMAMLAVIFYAITEGGRIGVGGNEAVFAFVAAVSAISATIPVAKSPRWLPNGPQWLILGLIVVLASQTRAVMIVLPVFAMIEIILFLKRYSLPQQSAAYAAILLALTTLAIVGPFSDIISKRFTGMVEYYDTGNSAKWEDKISADIREVLWASAADVIKQHPLVGVGSYSKMEIVRQEAGEQASMLTGLRHVHNAVLDELLNDGIVGLFFVSAAFIAVFAYLWRTASSWAMRRALIYFAVVCGAYGMLHNPLLHEVTIASIMFFIAALNAAASRRVMALRRAGLTNYMCRK